MNPPVLIAGAGPTGLVLALWLTKIGIKVRIIDKAPISRRLILKPKRANAWDPARLSREVREYATEFKIRPELRFNDLRGTKVTIAGQRA